MLLNRFSWIYYSLKHFTRFSPQNPLQRNVLVSSVYLIGLSTIKNYLDKISSVTAVCYVTLSADNASWLTCYSIINTTSSDPKDFNEYIKVPTSHIVTSTPKLKISNQVVSRYFTVLFFYHEWPVKPICDTIQDYFQTLNVWLIADREIFFIRLKIAK
jgi:hypothetical protein